jgi:murein L,D-transpeptidase YafK
MGIYNKYILMLISFMLLFQGISYAEKKTIEHNQDLSLIPDSLLFDGAKRDSKRDYYIIVEKSTQKLFIYDGDQNIIKTFRITTGQNDGNKMVQGDKRTPEGIYFAVDVLKAQDLTPEYGAMAIPMNYPNPVDISKNRSGKGIWIHATNHSDRLLKPFDTKGCVVTVNGDILEIAKYINLETTPIIISKKINYALSDNLKKEKQEVISIIDEWKQAWEAKDIDQYISYYSTNFSSSDMNVNQWKSHKERLNNLNSDIKIDIKDLKLIRNNEYIVAVFKQNYKSDIIRDIGIKRLYLTKTGQDWKISAEEWAALPVKSPTETADEYMVKNNITVPEKIIINNKIDIEDFYFSYIPPYEVRFRLVNISSIDEKLTGRIAVIAQGNRNNQFVYSSYPKIKLLSDGTPKDYKDGEWFSIKNYKIVTGQIDSLDSENISIDSIKVLVYSNDGEIILTKEFSNKAAKR